MLTAKLHDDDGSRWIRLVADKGNEWDEPITGWEYVIDLINGPPSYFRHKDGRIAMESKS